MGLGQDPFHPGEFTEIDPNGREIQGIVRRQFAIFTGATTQSKK
jgi:hypothetical protein